MLSDVDVDGTEKEKNDVSMVVDTTRPDDEEVEDVLTPLPNSTTTPRRPSHLTSLILESRKSLACYEPSLLLEEDLEEEEETDEEQQQPPPPIPSPTVFAGAATAAVSGSEDGGRIFSDRMQSVRHRMSLLSVPEPHLVEVRFDQFTYSVPVRADAPTVKTIFNQSVCYGAYELFRRVHQYRMYRKQQQREQSSTSPQPHPRTSIWRPTKRADVLNPYQQKDILKQIDLVFKPGKSYLILGPPAGGKTSLLKAIAGLLPKNTTSTTTTTQGKLYYNGISSEDSRLVLPNLVSFVGQLDIHAPYLTVAETFQFAQESRVQKLTGAGATNNERSNITLEGLDLTICADTFVGNADVRGVSGGQRRRVTVGEMLVRNTPISCGDEISTGLDAATTYSIIRDMVGFAKISKTTRIISLLQPGPETYSLFDEVVLLADGYVIYAGPIDQVEPYFESLGYPQKSTMDVADFLQLIATPDGALLLDESERSVHLTAEQFAAAFRESDLYQAIRKQLDTPSKKYHWKDVPEEFQIQYQNTYFRSIQLNFTRHLTLWKRDWGFIIGKMFENIGMAVATGGILFGAGKVPWSESESTAEFLANEDAADQIQELQAGIYGALFMTSFHILLGTMTSAPDEIDGRLIHYKHCDANFYPTGAFVIGRLLSTIPQRAIEIFSFGVPLYFMVGLDLSAGSFFTYISLLICYTIGLKMLFSILAQCLPTKANVQGVGTFVVLLMTLFGGFLVFPESIPNYYVWIYWANPMAWALQGLASNEFMSNKYTDLEGSSLLSVLGFQVGRQWIGFSFLYMIPFTFLCAGVLTYVLKYIRIEPEVQHVKKRPVKIGDSFVADKEKFNLPFTPVDLTFEKLVYEVDASTSQEKLRLLNEVSGAFLAGRMCALMGSSGAGKTTLLDVIAMRKTSGTVTGNILLNGFPQERISFLRASGYVEQFDVQQAELTVRETVTFCARLRLDASNPAVGSDAGKLLYVDHVLETMELTNIQALQVGSYDEGGLTFEQRKRLAIACELAGSPSVLFLDEPTSGLDSRGALVVMRAMKRIADTGRTVCATIHQPSSTVFEMFDDLLLLKRGGNVVFYGELGVGSEKLIQYFESNGALEIEFGENPAAWMFRALTAKQDGNEADWSEIYKTSEQAKSLQKILESVSERRSDSEKVYYTDVFATNFQERIKLMNKRILTVYKRSPAYNLTRLVIAIFYSFLIGSVFLRDSGNREVDGWTESDVNGVLGLIFLSTIIIGVTSISMAVPVMKKIRDVFYKHRASGMVEHNSLSLALAVGETPYVLLVSLLFGIIYYFTVGLFATAEKFFLFWLFFTLNVAIYCFFGQAFICLVPDVPTSGALVGALIGYNVFFSGYIVKPQYFSGPFQLGLWTAPGRFAFEGITMTQFDDIDDPVIATPNSPFFFHLNCTSTQCKGTMEEYVNFFFGGKFSIENFWLDFSVLMGYVILARLLIWFSLKKFNYVNT